MRLKKIILVLGFSLPSFLMECQGEKIEQIEKVRIPGYWFHLFLIVIPLFILLVKSFIDLGTLKDQLVSLGSQCRRIISRLEELEDKIKVLEKETKLEQSSGKGQGE